MVNQAPPRLPSAAATQWGDDGVLRAKAFDDVYFSREGGLEEARAVFLAGCGLPQRWQGRLRFTIAELGFGTALNALATWNLWRKARPPGAVLHFLSIEGHPLPQVDAARALAAFPEVADRAAKLLPRWPARAFGAQRLWLDGGFCLTVVIGEAVQALGALSAPVDAWFLDGFSPAKNPAMWDEAVIAAIARLSAPDATLATYSVAGAVRRGLERAGFTVNRAPGFGAKRERLEGKRTGAQAEPPPATKSVAIIGGGIAAASLAHALGRRGLNPTILCAGPTLADGASGNPAGLVMPRLDRDPGPASALFRQAFLAALDLYHTAAPQAFTPCGAVQRPDSERAAAAFADLLANPPLEDSLLRAAESGALHHVAAGMLDPAAAIAVLSADAALVLNARAQKVDARPGGGWAVKDAGDRIIAEAEVVVIAAGAGLGGFAQTAWLPMPLSAGQVEWSAAGAMQTALVQGAYAGPLPGGGVIFGASFEPTRQTRAEATQEARAGNLARLRALDPSLADQIEPDRLRSRASVRATTPDRLPLLGAAPHAAAWDTADVHAGPRWPGLYLFGGLGARGLTLSPLLAEGLAAQMLGEPLPYSPAIAAVIDPARFLARARKRGETLSG